MRLLLLNMLIFLSAGSAWAGASADSGTDAGVATDATASDGSSGTGGIMAERHDGITSQLQNETCGDDKDNDGDGFTDYADQGCITGASVERECGNGVDDDGDGATDTDDTGCADSVAHEGYVLDGNFGGNGVVVKDNDEPGASDINGLDTVKGMTLDAHSRIVTVGRYTTAQTAEDYKSATGSTDGATDMVVQRFLPDGTPDPSFGTGGVAKPGAGADHEGAKGEAVAIDSAGRIIIGGYTYSMDWDGSDANYDSKDLIIWRLLDNGELDTAFNGTGYFIYSLTDRKTAESISAVAIDESDGTARIVAAGGSFNNVCAKECNDFDLLLLRLTEDGEFDATFGGTTDPVFGGGTGYVVTGDLKNIGAYDYGEAIKIDADGKYVVAGRSSSEAQDTNYDMAVWRFNTDGSLDTSFGDGNGWVMHAGLGATGGQFTDEAKGVAVDAAGNIVAAGYTTDASSHTDVAVWRFTSTGDIDTSFGGGDGFTTYNAGVSDTGYSVTLDKSGRILVSGGLSASDDDADLFVLRLDNSGSLDTSFSADGLATSSATAGCNGSERAYAVIADGDDALVGGMGLNCKQKGDSVLLRYTAAGALDSIFNAEGLAATTGYHEYGKSALKLLDGKIILAGYRLTPEAYTYYDLALWRFNSDGTPDTTFADDGVITTSDDFDASSGTDNRWTADYDDLIQSATLDSAERIVATGYATWANGYSPMLVVWRFNNDGTLDESFSPGSTTGADQCPDGCYWLYSATNGTQKGNAVTVDSTDLVRVAGEQNNYMQLWFFADNGALAAAPQYTGARGKALAVTADASDRILATGRIKDGKGADYDMAVWRYLSDGTLDTSFANNGVYVYNPRESNGNDEAYAIAVTADGRVVTAGTSAGDGFTRATVWLYDPATAALDTAFDGDGVWVDDGAAGDVSTAYGIAAENDGFTVTGGGNVTLNARDVAVWRFLATGLDTDFGVAGLILKSGGTGGDTDAGYSVSMDVVSSDHGILIGGYSVDGADYQHGAVWRLH